MLEPNQDRHGFHVLSREPLAEIDGEAYVLRHEASGARLLYLKNDDPNKAFSIAFKTPPADDTGVFHILEHSVLCGSDKFPVKEPFVNLLKTSMQTFLNALTFPDKTMYPVASTNEQDLLNLMDVYLDAVLHPAIYGDRRIFEQEGWHYELDEAEGARRLSYNGVVFNEMKGALSDPESVLYHALGKALLPDTCYAFESGGDPAAIPSLTYEGYLDTHARHYRLDNSYIVLYGDMDVDRVLGFLDDRYLSKAERRSDEAPNAIGRQAPFVAPDATVEMDTAPENACVGLAYAVGGAHDFERVLAADVLVDALMGGNESPIKRAVLDAGIGGDCTAYLMDSQAQPAIMFLLRGAHPGAADAFRSIVEDQAAALVRDGIPKDLLGASLAQMSFDLRERDRGIADGVALAMNALAGWLYDDADATTYLHYEEPLAHMRAGLEGTYFEDLLEELVVESGHKALIDLVPTPQEGAGAQAVELAQKAAALSDEDAVRIEGEVESLRERQEAPDAPEDLATLPHLRVDDIGEGVPDPAMVELSDTPLPCLYHTVPTRKIDYLYAYFDLGRVVWEDVPYVTVLASLLGQLDTDERTAAELDVESRLHLGSLRFFTDVHVDTADPRTFRATLTVAASALSEEVESLAALPREVWAQTRFDDAARIKDVLVQQRIAMEQGFANEGHAKASARLQSYLFGSGVLADRLSGVGYYLFLKDLIAHFDERFEALKAKLAQVSAQIFVKNDVVVSFTGAPEDRNRFFELAGDFGLPESPEPPLGLYVQIPRPEIKREAFIVPSDVSYVAKGADVHQISDYAGAWVVLGNALSLDYLWNEVRVKGGAYGVGFKRTPIGFARFYSFRDPHIDETIERYDRAADWIASFDPSEEEMEGYIVSTVAAHDAPVKPRLVARRQDVGYFAHRAPVWREMLRDQELRVTPEAVRACAGTLRSVAASPAVCVFGSREAIEAASTAFDRVVDLLAE